MRLVVLFLPMLVAAAGCTIFGGNDTLSDWKVLDKAESLECEAFPQPSKVLRVRAVHVLEGRKAGFIAEVILRNGQKATYFVPFENSAEIETDKMVARDFGSGSIIVGGAGISSAVYGAILARGKGGMRLELRTLPDNIVRFKSPEIAIKPMSGKTYFTKHGVWLAYKVDANDVAEEDAELAVVFFKFGKKGKLIPRNFGKYKFPARARLLVDSGDRTALVVWGGEAKGNEKFQFLMTQLNPAKLTAEDPKRVDLPVSTEVESWAAAPAEDGMLVAYVDGDSLVGQAKLRISRVYWRQEYTKVGWKKEDKLTNIHVSEPVWQMVGRQGKLMIPKWVDGESTIGLYSVSLDGTVRPKVGGIFPKGSRVMTGFRDLLENEYYSVVRYRNKGAWQFEICNMENL